MEKCIRELIGFIRVGGWVPFTDDSAIIHCKRIAEKNRRNKSDLILRKWSGVFQTNSK